VNPYITVLMPVYNGDKYLREAIDSILNQSFHDYEFLIIDDGSTDRSAEVIESYNDSRIQFVRNKVNLGLIAALNMGLALARGEYVARMDQDDISLPERLKKQADFMDQHSNLGICGTWSQTFGEVEKSWLTSFPVGHVEIMSQLLFNTAISHPTAMFDMKKFRSLNLRYDMNALHAEDYNLWVEASDYFNLGNVPEVLLLYRVHHQQTCQAESKRQQQTTAMIREKMLDKMGVVASDDEIMLHLQISNYFWEKSRHFYADSKRWFKKLEGMVDPRYKKAVRRECLQRLIKLHQFVFGRYRVFERIGLRFIRSV
jgi:glycosyltransferase involved in cell wall biosynthesis